VQNENRNDGARRLSRKALLPGQAARAGTRDAVAGGAIAVAGQPARAGQPEIGQAIGQEVAQAELRLGGVGTGIDIATGRKGHVTLTAAATAGDSRAGPIPDNSADSWSVVVAVLQRTAIISSQLYRFGCAGRQAARAAGRVVEKPLFDWRWPTTSRIRRTDGGQARHGMWSPRRNPNRCSQSIY
jgi:hypothetical protein